MNLRVRGPDGQTTLSGAKPGQSVSSLLRMHNLSDNHLLSVISAVFSAAGLDPAMTVGKFQQELADRLGVPPHNQEVLAGFPPKLLQVSGSMLSRLHVTVCMSCVTRHVLFATRHTHCCSSVHDDVLSLQLSNARAEVSIATLGLASGDTVVVRRVASTTPSAPAASAPNGSAALPIMQDDTAAQVQRDALPVTQAWVFSTLHCTAVTLCSKWLGCMYHTPPGCNEHHHELLGICPDQHPSLASHLASHQTPSGLPLVSALQLPVTSCLVSTHPAHLSVVYHSCACICRGSEQWHKRLQCL